MAAPKSRHAGRRVQLHRAISKLGWGSRTEAWEWIRTGQVGVDGRVVTDPLTWVDVGRQRITRQGQQPPGPGRVVLALHKPRGIVTTRRDERGRPTVFDLLPTGIPYVFPVGRLDAESEGLLILTNDSDLATRLTAPKHHAARIYRVTVRGVPSPAALGRLRSGVKLLTWTTKPAHVRVLRKALDKTVVEMVLSEGRNRQIRRMFAAVGHRVLRLVRVGIGGFALGKLPPGATRQLDRTEIAQLLTG